MKYRTTFEADRDIIEIYVLGAEQFGVPQSERYVSELFGTFELLAAIIRKWRGSARN
ncbi:hypothetical protein ACK9YZ_04305 [Rhizobium sp. ZK1]|uniref:hypothetical protein n=1 Tax=Rhizobium sp. ZK1 TaxID=3389872 RepID=UPI0039F70AB3